MSNAPKTLAQIIAVTRRISGLTAAQCDYGLAHSLCPEHHPARTALGMALDQADEQVRPALREQAAAYIRECAAKSYTGWSDHSRARGAKISYA